MGGMGGSSAGSGDKKPSDHGFSDLTRNYHFERHGNEYEAKTESEYENLAIEFREKPLDETTRSFISNDGYRFKYDESSNDFLITKPDGEIVTLYKPTDGLAYWERQVLKYGPTE
jgi:pyocin large subunit-like protein